MNITVIAVGKLKEKHYIAACEEYEKRLGQYCKLQIVELPEYRLPENPSAAEIEIGLKKEAEDIRRTIPKNAYFIVCTPEGKGFNSERFADHIRQKKQEGYSSFCFLIGSSNGIHEELKREAKLKLSVSDMTFPHHLFRVMLLEQIYREEAIQAGSKYHK